MPPTTHQRDTDRPHRRDLLLAGGAAGAAVLLAGCSGAADAGSDRAGRTAAADRLRARAERDSLVLLARYDATSAAHPVLADRLRPLRAETARHAQAFAGSGGARSGSPAAASPPGRAASPSAGVSPGGDTSAPRPPGVPGTPEQALAVLAQAERLTADARTAALASAPGELARLLASVAACGAAHAYLLTEGVS
ncbi:hypothetical protein ACQUSR_08170 [Streptomyces sp. P1-3]|uniref:hypothetical protein n=1 Tax=Streptomyces sp. P1-3 TaxID=3421658 RepID=UPI003D35DB55